MDRNNKGANNTFWTIVVAIETVILQIFEDKRIFVVTAVFIAGALVWEAIRHSLRSRRVKGVLWREKQHLQDNVLRQQDSPQIDATLQEDFHRREREIKDLLSAGVIESAEYNDRLAELKAHRRY
ncbi:MAG TPA: hypothetical protein VN626_01795 [Clostridia bacterium]|nr:hypothetical protein [Clostridia bacterium]